MSLRGCKAVLSLTDPPSLSMRFGDKRSAPTCWILEEVKREPFWKSGVQS
ncbi:MAG: hypothetical protein VX278_00225 [Myxococcota bacterium]|nr:hypothetical protein [Myxococcota bacterium]